MMDTKNTLVFFASPLLMSADGLQLSSGFDRSAYQHMNTA